MRALSFAFALVVPVVLTAQAPTAVTIDSGMTRADVVAKLGAPLSAKTSGTSTFLSYPNGCEKTCGMADLVILENDHVVDAIFRSPLHRYSGKSSSPRMISRDEARSIAVAKGDTSTPPAPRQTTSPAAATQSALKLAPPAADTAKHVAAAPPKTPSPVTQAGAPAAPKTAASKPPALATTLAPPPSPAKAAVVPNRSTGASPGPVSPAPNRSSTSSSRGTTSALSRTSATMPSTSVQITGLPAFLIGMTPLAVIGFFFLVIIVGMWRVFEKAGKPGWAAFVPIYNLVVTLDIAEKPIWWLFLMLIPGVNVIAWILVMVAFAERFGKGPLFGLGLTFLSMIFYPVLGFGEAQYSA